MHISVERGKYGRVPRLHGSFMCNRNPLRQRRPNQFWVPPCVEWQHQSPIFGRVPGMNLPLWSSSRTTWETFESFIEPRLKRIDTQERPGACEQDFRRHGLRSEIMAGSEFVGDCTWYLFLAKKVRRRRRYVLLPEVDWGQWIVLVVVSHHFAQTLGVTAWRPSG